MKFCTKCGTKLDDNAKFCASCGQASDTPSTGAPPSSPPAAPPGVAPTKKGMSGCAIAAIVAGGLAVLGIVFVTGLIVLVGFFTGDVVKATEDYLALLKQGRVEEAYEASASGLREATSLDEFKQVVAAFPILARHTSFSIESRNIDNDTGNVSGELRDAAGHRTSVEFDLVKENGVWRVLSMHVKSIALAPSRVNAIAA